MAAPLEIAHAYFDAWNRHDADAVVATFAGGGTYADPTSGGELTGEAIGQYAAGLWSAFPDLSFDIVSDAEAGTGTVAAQWVMKGTNTTPFQGLPPTGKALALPGADFIRVGEGGIESVVGYFDSAGIPKQLGLDIIVQPDSIGPFSFGRATTVQSGKKIRPGAFSITQIVVRSAEEAQRLSEYSRKTAQEMLEMDGFIGLTLAFVGNRGLTISACEEPDNSRQLLRKGTHPEAMKAFWTDIGSSAYTSIWTSERFNPTWVRCLSCGKMVSLEKTEGVCSCGEALPEPAPYW